ncbi:unnamed protein product [Callosobruchus maculatus]|uniref:Uncharacterized protein n=1 Tax=Callosobruchus maculatus TaxID=64391 RepID=A0A653C4C3_CALMS|nr:unnamed protein product [Callosobruchus maculatus]
MLWPVCTAWTIFIKRKSARGFSQMSTRLWATSHRVVKCRPFSSVCTKIVVRFDPMQHRRANSDRDGSRTAEVVRVRFHPVRASRGNLGSRRAAVEEERQLRVRLLFVRTAVSSLRSLDELEPAELHALCKRASSIYTDSSEDISSLTSTDWPPDLQPNISTIVDYFERKGATLRHPGGVRAGLQLSSRIAALRRSLERHNQGASSSGTLPGQRPKCTSRLVICEGAVRSKLPLFDKKP